MKPQCLLLVILLVLPTRASSCVTRWFDRDDPSGVGDFETTVDLRKEYPGQICSNPIEIEAQTVDGIPAGNTGQIFNPFNAAEGFACVNAAQKTGSCRDYRVRFTCPPEFCSGCTTRWFDRDDPSGVGDFETTVDLKKEYPGQICSDPIGIEAQTVDGIPAGNTGQIFNPFNAAEGFACVNAAQKTGSCRDYRVRFTCPPEFCSGCTTRWFDRDDPSGKGDYELTADLRKEYPNGICAEPVAISVQTLDGTPASQTGQTFAVFDATEGFACVNQDQVSEGKSCRDYKVRFSCPKSFC
ncbi:uncharacterized protein LOC134294504 [Anolis carolinensis]|uniref:uncharacterized protein LOC134294504 n=1 Tax=Anolis carolinensis TaxID=28377 RepID=UPI002F2B624C